MTLVITMRLKIVGIWVFGIIVPGVWVTKQEAERSTHGTLLLLYLHVCMCT